MIYFSFVSNFVFFDIYLLVIFILLYFLINYFLYSLFVFTCFLLLFMFLFVLVILFLFLFLNLFCVCVSWHHSSRSLYLTLCSLFSINMALNTALLIRLLRVPRKGMRRQSETNGDAVRIWKGDASLPHAHASPLQMRTASPFVSLCLRIPFRGIFKSRINRAVLRAILIEP